VLPGQQRRVDAPGRPASITVRASWTAETVADSVLSTGSQPFGLRCRLGSTPARARRPTPVAAAISADWEAHSGCGAHARSHPSRRCRPQSTLGLRQARLAP
jgi:hypothetical protein